MTTMATRIRTIKEWMESDISGLKKRCQKGKESEFEMIGEKLMAQLPEKNIEMDYSMFKKWFAENIKM